MEPPEPPTHASVTPPEGEPAPVLRLHELEPGQVGTIARVDAVGSGGPRLKAMGVCVGRRVALVKRGDPLILRVLGTRVGLSARLAQLVWVTFNEHDDGDAPAGE